MILALLAPLLDVLYMGILAMPSKIYNIVINHRTKNFIDFSIKTLSKAFKHDVYSSQSKSSELADMSTSVSYNSNCMGLMSELYRFLARCTLLSETVTNLEAGRNWLLWIKPNFWIVIYHVLYFWHLQGYWTQRSGTSLAPLWLLRSWNPSSPLRIPS